LLCWHNHLVVLVDVAPLARCEVTSKMAQTVSHVRLIEQNSCF
jgi:hypothetical protein